MDYQGIYIVGDLHEDYHCISYCINNNEIKDSIFIQVGDFGVGFRKNKEKKELQILNKILLTSNCKLLVIRGNHDDPSYFNLENKEYSNIEFLEDYSIRDINGKNFLFIGGAISIDRIPRIKNYKENRIVEYWKNEGFNYLPDKIIDKENISYVITHNSPNFVSPLTFSALVYNYSTNDQELIKDLEEERKKITDVYDILVKKNNLIAWYYGHFHFSNLEYIKETKFKLLSINEITECFLG